jgi:hypothetical protein
MIVELLPESSDDFIIRSIPEGATNPVKFNIGETICLVMTRRENVFLGGAYGPDYDTVEEILSGEDILKTLGSRLNDVEFLEKLANYFELAFHRSTEARKLQIRQFIKAKLKGVL